MKLALALTLTAFASQFTAMQANANNGFLLGQGGMSCRKALQLISEYRSCGNSQAEACITSRIRVTRTIEYMSGFMAGLKAAGVKTESEYTQLIDNNVMNLNALKSYCEKNENKYGHESEDKKVFDYLKFLSK
jgi:hypothetical protein